MSKLLSNMTLLSRLLLAIAIALVISSIIADLYGARLTSSYTNNLPQEPNISIFLGASALTSSGKIRITVEGASAAYYIKLSGDPFTIIQQLRALRLNISASRPQVDLRAGVAYAVALIQAHPAIVQALSALGELIPVVQTEGSTVIVEETLNTGESIAMIVTTPAEPIAKVRMEYSVTGYSRLTPSQAIITSIAILILITAIELLRRLRA